jgi:glycosyltransferase involved in cell wall biosynthesis
MENIKVSVIIPNWNSEKTLKATIQSCLNQTLPPFEIIVCDDGSTDNSKNVVENINDPRVIWVPHSHTGTPAIPRNNGMKISKGEWIAFCDSDDKWLPTKLEKQIRLIKRSGCKAICTDAFIKKNNIITTQRISNWKKVNISFNNLLWDNKIVCSSAIIHSSIFKDIGGFPEELEYKSFEDYIYWLRVTTRTNFIFLNEPLIIYDDHPETSLRSLCTDGKLIKEKTIYNLLNWTKKNKLYLNIFKVKKYLFMEWVNKLIYDKIKLCLKK